MRMWLTIGLPLVTLLFTPALGDGAGGKRRAEQAWAKQTATDFLGVYLRGPAAQAEQLLTPELRRLPKDVLDGQLFEAHNLGYRRAEVKAESLAPDRDEAVFRGELLTEKAERAAVFTVRVTRGTDGKWRVGFFHFVERPAAAKK
jgi:hypothetical protein